MRIAIWLIALSWLLVAPLSCDDDGGGKISRYCHALCAYQDECTEWFDEQWDDFEDCERECKEGVLEGSLGDVCRAQALDLYICQYENTVAEDCDGTGVMDECDNQFDAYQDCMEEHGQDGWGEQH